jgi:hypothetical protein
MINIRPPVLTTLTTLPSQPAVSASASSAVTSTTPMMTSLLAHLPDLIALIPALLIRPAAPLPAPAAAPCFSAQLDAPISVRPDDYQHVAAWLAGNGSRPARLGEGFTDLNDPMNGAGAYIKQMVWPRVPDLNAVVGRARRSWTACPSWRQAEASVARASCKTYRILLASSAA